MNNLKCKYYKSCGNCQLLNKTYQDTLIHKLNYVNNCLAKYNIRDKVSDIVPSEKNFGYRNKMILGYKFANGKIISGFYEENSHKIVDIEDCLMHSELQNEIARGIKKIFTESLLLLC